MNLQWRRSARLFWSLSTSVILILVGGCGTRDYDPPKGPKSIEEDVREALKEQIKSDEEGGVEPQAASMPFAQQDQEPESEGWLWRGMDWASVSDERVVQIQDWLSDNVDSRNNFDALGLTLAGGAALGIIFKVSGSWFFGGPVEGQESHWFWRRLDEAAKGTAQGFVRGGLFAGACYLLLKGIDPLPFEGILGQQYAVLSSALILGGMSAGVSSVFTKKFLSPDLSHPKSSLGKTLHSKNFMGRGMDAIQQWTTSTSIGRGMRYQVVPGLVIVGVGSGVGVLVFNFLQPDPMESGGENSVAESFGGE